MAISVVNENHCVSCGCCIKYCPKDAIEVKDGMRAVINSDLCIGCGKCVSECPHLLLMENLREKEIKFVLKNGMIICGFFQLFTLL